MASVVAITFSVDASELEHAATRIKALLELLKEHVSDVVDVHDLSAEDLFVVVSDFPTDGTRDVRIRLQPSDRLLGLVSALEALEG